MSINKDNINDFVKYICESVENDKITGINKFLEMVQESVDDAEMEKGSLSELVFLTYIRDLAQAIKIENTNLLKVMPCRCALEAIGCSPAGVKPKEPRVIKCERCKQLEERSENKS